MQIKSFYLAPVPEEITDLTVISTLQLKELITFDRLFAELKYNEFTLLDMDIIDLDGRVSEPLMKDILNDGHILYERTGK